MTILLFRQDLRIEDNPALNAALSLEKPIIPLYILEDSDPKWKMGQASLVWLHDSLKLLSQDLEKLGLKLKLRKGVSKDVLEEIVKETDADTILWNRCYEPASIKRDAALKSYFKTQGVVVKSFNASLLFEPWEIQNKQQKPFKVFTPFWKTCMQQNIAKPHALPKCKAISYDKKLFSEKLEDLQLLPKIHWDKTIRDYWKPGSTQATLILNRFLEKAVLNYQEARDLPAIDEVSHLSPYLHFGEISPRMIWDTVLKKFKGDEPGVACFLRQLIWREFAHHLLYHFPKTPNEPMYSKFENFPWKNDKLKLKAWQKGRTGYPLVDAGMRQLWATGWMHNRVRMVVGSFLVKDLLIPWQEGASWFFDTLVDADLANNTLGWQWVAGCGADAAPYYRIFNPTTQAEKFDAEGDYIRKWVPELALMPTKWIHKPHLAPVDVLEKSKVVLGKTYPKQLVDHDKARIEALNALKQIKEE